jgi:thiol:disulfide interchange protein DsbA
MFGCIHCFAFEPILTSWVESRADSVDFVRVPVIFNEVARLHAQAYYTAEALGVADTIVGPFYSEIHERGRSLASVDEIRELFASYGVDGALFDATFDSFGVRTSLRRAEELNRLYGVDSTPTIGVAGKYRTNVSMAGGSNEALFDVVDSLVEAEALQRATSATPPCEGRDNCPRLQLFESPQQLLEAVDQLRQHAPETLPPLEGRRF